MLQYLGIPNALQPAIFAGTHALQPFFMGQRACGSIRTYREQLSLRNEQCPCASGIVSRHGAKEARNRGDGALVVRRIPGPRKQAAGDQKSREFWHPASLSPSF